MSSLRHVLVTSVPALTSDTHRSMRQCQQSLINRSPGGGHSYTPMGDVLRCCGDYSTAQYSTEATVRNIRAGHWVGGG